MSVCASLINNDDLNFINNEFDTLNTFLQLNVIKTTNLILNYTFPHLYFLHQKQEDDMLTITQLCLNVTLFLRKLLMDY